MRLVGDFNCKNTSTSETDVEDSFYMPELNASSLPSQPGFPGEVEMILSAMEAAQRSAGDRRNSNRSSYRTQANLRLFSDDPLSDPSKLYTRDLHEHGIGFITRERLPLGYGGIVELKLPNGSQAQIHCVVFRCRETINGWFEGAITFTRAQNWM